MPGLIRNFSWLASFTCSLLAIGFFVATATAGESSPFSDKLLTAETGLIRLAAYTEDKPQGPEVNLQRLKKEMDHVFKVLSAIMKDESLTDEEKRAKVKDFIRDYRYGPEKKDYFWINDLQGKMIVNPQIPDLEGKVVTNVRDADGTRIFIKFINVSLNKGEGFVDYLWREDEKEAPKPKTSLVKLLKEWGWVVGTGMYLETIEAYEMPIEPGDLPPIDDRNPASPV
ncbi:MAG: cache domain-containing protein [Deltaproteobacteria bacterium]|nr:cache domain-containing protein [Deltaproteobacteria bacterium]